MRKSGELLNEMTQLNSKATDMGKKCVKMRQIQMRERVCVRVRVCLYGACNAIHNNYLQWKQQQKINRKKMRQERNI